MYTKSILLASLAASAVSASKQLYPGHNQIKRDVAARQTDTSPSAIASAGQACLTDLASAYASLPTPPPVLADWEATVVISDPCAFTIPESISSAAVQYESEVEDWYSSNSAAIASALSECPAYSSYASEGDGGDFSATDYTDACATATGGGAGGSDATTTKDSETTAKGTGTAATTATTKGGSGVTAGSGSGSTGTTTAATTTATNAGPKETGAIGVAAMAVVGVLGVVAAL
ncbi:hypothetical protein Sste5346_005065 [Sporothrix stenoceras]|uniref:Infection structure specific protein n=1 Tax=Sporothrix stenoceras TaxID=5173 RepID=A0ABR3Z4N9_9PEZI